MFNRLKRLLYRFFLKAKGANLQHSIVGYNFLFGNYKGLITGHHNWIESGVKLNIAGENTQLILKDYIYINSYCVIDCHHKIELGGRLQMGPHCYITDFDHDIQVDIRNPHHRANKSYAPVCIEDNVWLGAGVIVLKGVTIGKNSVIAAGSVVTKAIPANVVAAGSPAKVIKHIEGNYDNPNYWEQQQTEQTQ